MNKLIIEILVPASGEKYEMFIPSTTQMYKVLALIKKAVTEMSDGRYEPNDQAVLCNRATGSMLNLDLTATELGIKNGTKLMLI